MCAMGISLDLLAEPLVDNSPTCQIAEPKQSYLLRGDLGDCCRDCSKHSGLFVDILDFGSPVCNSEPDALRSKWEYTTVVTGSTQVVGRFHPGMVGRNTFMRGMLKNRTYEWKILTNQGCRLEHHSSSTNNSKDGNSNKETNKNKEGNNNEKKD